MNMSCIKCDIIINERNDKFIKCDGCNRSIHIICSELSDTEIKCFTLRPSSRRRIKYICIECEQGVHQIPKLITLINDLKDEIRKLKEQYNELSSASSTSKTLNASPSNTLNPEELISEIYERNKRSQNIIFYGSPEDGTSKQDQIQRDTVTINSVLTEVGVVVDGIKPVRLGRFDATKQLRTRPIRVRLSSSDDVFAVIRKFKKLKTVERFSRLSVSTDRTPQQVAAYKAVRSELATRLSMGESDLRIKYRNGFPTIVRMQSEN